MNFQKLKRRAGRVRRATLAAVGSPLMPAPCVFDAIIRGEQQAVTVLETERLIAFLDHRPLFYGHTLLVPKLHVPLLSDLPADRVPEFFTTAQRLERAVEDGLGADGSMILINNVVSQSVPHLHLHVIPRNKRDGLRLWLGPRHPYDDGHPAEAYAEKIRAALPPALFAAADRTARFQPALRWVLGTGPLYRPATLEPQENPGEPACPTIFRVPTASRVTCSLRCPPGMTASPSCSPSARTGSGGRRWSTGSAGSSGSC